MNTQANENKVEIKKVYKALPKKRTLKDSSFQKKGAAGQSYTFLNFCQAPQH